jgi:hypothetical protein
MLHAPPILPFFWITPQTFGEIICEVPHLIFYLYVYPVAHSGIIHRPYRFKTDSNGLILQSLKRVSRQHKTQNVSVTVKRGKLVTFISYCMAIRHSY